MPVKMASTTKELHSLVMGRADRASYFTNIKNFLHKKEMDDEPQPQTCSSEMMKKMTVVLQEELAKKQFKEVSTMISAMQYVARAPDYLQGLPLLLSNGLVNLLAYALEETRDFVSLSDGSKEDTSADSLMERILETINDVADSSEDAKNQSVAVFTEKLMRIIVGVQRKFWVRMEALRTLNLLLEGCQNDVVQLVRDYPPSIKLMGSMASLLTSAGDFEMQVACTESLARLVRRSESSNHSLIQELFSDDELASSFQEIKDNTFETDCRKFLNFVNGRPGTKRSVLSVPCIDAYLGSYKLMCPQDENLKEFWVDFNTVSHRISLYVADEPDKENDDGGMWETVTITKEAVHRFHVSERGEQQALFISLSKPASQLLALCPSDDSHAHIIFDAKEEVCSAAIAVFGHEKLRTSKQKSSVSQISIQVHLDDSCASPGPQRNIRSAEESSETVSLQSARISEFGTTLNEGPPEGCATSELLTRCKIPVPNPMWTPTARHCGLDSSSVCSSARSLSTIGFQKNVAQNLESIKSQLKKCEFTQPKTPVKPSTSKRVKTPLQITVSDKAADSGNESTSSHPSTGRKASISSGLSIRSSDTPTRLHQRLQQAQADRLQDVPQTDAGHRSDSSLSLMMYPGRDRTLSRNDDNARHQIAATTSLSNGYKSDSCVGSNKEIAALPKRQLRPRAPSTLNPPKASVSKPVHQEMMRADKKEQGSYGEDREPKTKEPSRKFRLYSDNGDMLMEPGDAHHKQALDTDVVIPSSVPTQESVEVIPDSLPASNQPPPTRSTPNLPVRTRSICNVTRLQCSPVLHSPSLSTLTEESTLSAHSKNARNSAASGGDIGGETVSRCNKILPTLLQESIIEEVPAKRRGLRPRAGSKASKANPSRPEDSSAKIDEGRQTGTDKRGGGDTGRFPDRPESATESDDDGSQATGEFKSEEVPGRFKNGSRTDRQRHPAGRKTDKSARPNPGNSKVIKRGKSTPPPTVSSDATESSQELSQLDFTSRRDSPSSKVIRPRKGVQKESKGKGQPSRRGGKKGSAELPIVKGPRLRQRREAAKVARKEIRIQRQLMDAVSDVTSHNHTSNYEPTDTCIDSQDGGSGSTVSSEVRTAVKRPSSAKRRSPYSGQNFRESPMQDFVNSKARKSLPSASRSDRSPESQTKRKLLNPTPVSQDFSVYEFVDTESSMASVVTKNQRKKNPGNQSANAARRGKQQSKQSKVPVMPKTSKRHQESPIQPSYSHEPPKDEGSNPQSRITLRSPYLGDELSGSVQSSPEVRKPRRKPLPKKSAPRKRPANEDSSDPTVGNTDEQDNTSSSRHPWKRSRLASPDQEELSDIEQPRDAGALSGRSRHSPDVNFDQFCDEDVHSFVQSLTKKQKGCDPRDVTTEDELLPGNRIGSKRSDSKLHKMPGLSTPTLEVTNKELHRKLNQTPVMISASIQGLGRQRGPNPPSGGKTPSLATPLETEIIEIESEEVSPSANDCSVPSEDGNGSDCTSLTNFSKMCQSIVEKSGHGLAAKRALRNIPRIDYHCPDSFSSGGEVAGSDERDEDSCLLVEERHSVDAVSEKSWLAEKPKQRVTTYSSKSQSQEWVVHTSIMNLDTTVKKKQRPGQNLASKRKQIPPVVPSKKSKLGKKADRDADDDDPDGFGMCLYYHTDEAEESTLGNQHKQQAQTSRPHRVEKTSRRPAPRRTSTPLVVPQTLVASPEEDEGQDSSIEVARDYHQEIGEVEADLCPLTPLTPLHIDEDIKAQILADLATPNQSRKTPSSISSKSASFLRKTPKQVSFGLDPNREEDASPLPRQKDSLLKSGPSTWMHPTASVMKQKYGSLFSDVDSGESEQDVLVVSDTEDPCMGLDDHGGQGSLKPKKLFKRTICSPSLEEALTTEGDEEGNDDMASSTSSTSLSLPGMQMTNLLKAVSENLKRKMMSKRTETQQLTDGAMKTTQRKVSRLWSQQHQARETAQEDFKNHLLTEILSLEQDVDNLQKNYSKMKVVMEQRHRNVACTLMQHVQRMKSLHVNQLREARELNDRLGSHLLHNVKQILTQEMVSIQEKLSKQAQQHELDQMKKGLRTMFMF